MNTWCRLHERVTKHVQVPIEGGRTPWVCTICLSMIQGPKKWQEREEMEDEKYRKAIRDPYVFDEIIKTGIKRKVERVRL